MNKINGPINVVRMEGSINNIRKVIYLFMDEHLDIDKQTNCNDPNSIDIQDFFKKSFANLKNNKTYDFFLETFPSHSAYEINELPLFSQENEELIYLQNLWKFFYQYLKFDLDTNTVSSLFKNVRLHYLDIRDVWYSFLTSPLLFVKAQLNANHEYVPDMVNTAINVILEFMKTVETILSTKKIDKVIKKQIISKLEYNIVPFLTKSEYRKEYLEQAVYLLDKLLNKYQHNNVKKIINGYIDSFLIKWQQYIKDLTILYNNVKDLSPNAYQDKVFINKLDKDLDYFHTRINSYLVRLVDIYFLRRFLDKDYITNAIVYTGAAHSVIYICLLRQIGFKITHCFNCSIKNINELNKAVSKIKNFPTEQDLFYLMDLFVTPNRSQCIDLSEFPDDFL